MASVVGSVSGGEPKRVQARTVQEVKTALNLSGNYTAAINGEPAELGDMLSDEDYVTFATAVKGGASVVGSVSGGEPKRVEADTVSDVKRALNLSGNYTAAINGEPAELGDFLSDEDYVTFATAVKGGCR